MEPVQPFQMNIYKSNTYRKYLSWLHFGNEPRVQERQQMEDQRTCISVFVACPTNPVFHAWPYGRFIEIKNNLRKKKHIINQGSNLLGWSYSNIDNVIVPIQFRRECQPQHLKILFFHKNRLIVSPALKSTSGFLLHSTVSHSSDSSSDANSSCCHRSDTWSHLE